MSVAIGSDNVYTDQQARIGRDLAHRAEENQRQVDEINRQRIMLSNAPTPLIIVADGDSWFDYPLPVFGHTDVADSVQRLAKLKPAMMKLAHHGDATTTLMGVTKRQRLIDYISDPQHGPIDVIMFSGGGNDLVGDQFRFWLKSASDVGHDASKGVDVTLLDDILDVVLSAYVELIKIRNERAKNAHILIHAYDFAIPTNKGACRFAGPWLAPSLREQGWPDLGDGQLIVRAILTAFRARLQELSASNPRLTFVDTQCTLGSDEWANELHPTPDGFDKIATKFITAIRAIPEFNDRI